MEKVNRNKDKIIFLKNQQNICSPEMLVLFFCGSFMIWIEC